MRPAANSPQWSPPPPSAARAAEEWRVQGRYADLDAVLDDESVSVVHVCTPNALHVRQTEAALAAGKHVVCEKPLATSAAEAERLTRLAQESGLVLAVPFVYRYHPLVREIRDRRLRGEFGAWQLIHGSYLQDWMLSEDAMSWRVDPDRGGPSRAFADIGSHWCDLVEWVAGVRFTEVTARLGTTVPTRPTGTAGPRAEVRTEDVATVLMRTGEGVLANLTVSQVSAGRKNRLWFELDGSAASAVFDQENPETVWLGAADGARLLVRDPNHGSAEQRRLSRLPAGHPPGVRRLLHLLRRRHLRGRPRGGARRTADRRRRCPLGPRRRGRARLRRLAHLDRRRRRRRRTAGHRMTPQALETTR